MQLDRYQLKAGRDFTTFEFLSEGIKGKITKLVQFQQTGLPNLYNLAFGDVNPLTGELDDKIITNNGDSEKVLATVVAAVYAFTARYPNGWVYATGSTVSRTRLYRMGINKYLDVVDQDFDIMGEYQSDWEWYEKGKDYQAFAVHRKNQ
jgi:hypothetical protein